MKNSVNTNNQSLVRFSITDEPTSDYYSSMEPMDAASLEEAHNRSYRGDKTFEKELLSLQKKYPDNPQIGNHLIVLYKVLEQHKKAEQLIEEHYRAFPDYLFALEEQSLKDLYRCRQSFLEDQTRLSNRMENLVKEKTSFKIWENLLENLEKKIKDVDAQIKALLEAHENLGKQVDLLKTIPGISQKTAVAILSELPPIQTFETAKEVAAFAGLTPSVRQSGTSIRGRGALSKSGNAQLRKALYMPALVAKKYNPLVSEFCKRLTGKGKAKMVVIAAAMRKLLHIIFGVLKHQKPFTFSGQVS